MVAPVCLGVLVVGLWGCGAVEKNNPAKIHLPAFVWKFKNVNLKCELLKCEFILILMLFNVNMFDQKKMIKKMK